MTTKIEWADMTAEQWLADLEAKAKAATPGPWVMDGVYPIYSIGRGGLKDKTIGNAQRQWDGDFISAANPATVLRLVGMVRWLAAQRQELLSGYCPEDMRVGCLGNCIDCRHGQIAIKSAYAATETRHDQN